ncbi:MAG: FtsX-like permease family protein [bacterium]|nr:FtsX-like permease family protein [bacterium]
MSILRMLLKELWHRRLNFVLGLAAVIAAVALFVAVLTMSGASERETTRLMRDMGFNILIVPKNTDMADFWSEDFGKQEMPEEYVYTLANFRGIAVQHLVATLQKKVAWRDRKVLLTGVLPEAPIRDAAKKPPMGFRIPRGKVYVGYELANGLKIKAGDTVNVLGKDFVVERCLLESGSKDDIRIYGHLHDIQEILGSPGKINAIEALGCRCEGERLPTIRKSIAKALPETKVTELRPIAVARAKTREMVENYAAFLIPTVFLICAVWVGFLALSNVRERRQEIGILRALGFRSGRIAALFLGRAIVLGLLGAGAGFGVGTALALRFGPQIFRLTSAKIMPVFSLLGWSLAGAAALCAMASYLPTIVAVTQDPAVTLRDE